jgi:hypothetical protein
MPPGRHPKDFDGTPEKASSGFRQKVRIIQLQIAAEVFEILDYVLCKAHDP